MMLEFNEKHLEVAVVKQNEKISLVDYTDKYEEICEGTDLIPGELFDVYGVKRGTQR